MDPLPEFNAYSLYDVITNFWILGVIALICTPYQLCAALYGFVRYHLSHEDLTLAPECVIIHVVIYLVVYLNGRIQIFGR